jgi:hypothetical protein
MEDDMRILYHEISEIYVDTSSGNSVDYATTIVLKTGVAIILPGDGNDDIVMTITLDRIDQHNEKCGDWEYYLMINI